MKLLLTTIKGGNPSTELGLRSLYGVVADAPIDSTFKMYEPKALNIDIYDEIVRGQFNIIYFHVDHDNERRISDIAEMVKKALPSCVIVCGGMQVSFDSKTFMTDNPSVDYVIRGEGESVLFNFLKTLLTYEFDFDTIPGLAYRKDYSIIVNPYDSLISPEDIPFPYERTEIFDTKKVYYETIRGTADRSSYTQHLSDARVRALSLNRVCTELRYFLVKRVDKVVFLDKYFNYNTERSYRIIEYIINNDNGVTSFEMNVDGDRIDDETIRLLGEARPGLFTFNIDVASTNAETLAAVGRKENIYQLMYNVNRLMQAAQVKIQLSITAGLPLETEQLFARTFNKVYGLGEGNTLKINTIRMSKGTVLREQAENYGYVYCSNVPYDVIATGTLPAPELIQIKTIAGIVDKYVGEEFNEAISKLMTDTALKPYDFFYRLTNFIYDRGLNRKMDKKENLYRILYVFAESLYDEAGETLKLQILMELLHDELEKNVSEDAVKKFERKGWDIEA